MSVIHTIHERDTRSHQSQISRGESRGSNIFTLQDRRLDRQHISFILENCDISTLMADVTAARERFGRESLGLKREIQQLNKNITRLEEVLDIIDKEQTRWEGNLNGLLRLLSTWLFISLRSLGIAGVGLVDQRQTHRESLLVGRRENLPARFQGR